MPQEDVIPLLSYLGQYMGRSYSRLLMSLVIFSQARESEQEQALGALDGSLQPALSTWETFQPGHRGPGPKAGLCERYPGRK